MRKSSTAIFVFLIIVLASGFTQIIAQETKKTKQIKLLNNYGEIPFEDGKTIIEKVEFIGLDGDYEKYDETIGKMIRERDVSKALREQRADIVADTPFYGYKVSKLVKILREVIKSSGYINAKIEAYGELLAKNKMKLTISVERGLPIFVSEIRFEGNVFVTNQEFTADLKRCLGDGWYVFDKKKYEHFIQKCSRQLMFSKGFFKAKIHRVVPRIVSNSYVVTIGVNEGDRYRLGDLIIKGSKVFTPKEILKMSELISGEVADGKKIREFFQKDLKRIYEDEGYLEFDAWVDPSYVEPLAKGLDGFVNIEVEIAEGVAFKVAELNFLGVEEEKARELSNDFPVKVGEIFNKTKFEEGIKELNQTEKFLTLDSDLDTEMRLNPDKRELYLYIKLY